jgi:TatD DNase family protein
MFSSSIVNIFCTSLCNPILVVAPLTIMQHASEVVMHLLPFDSHNHVHMGPSPPLMAMLNGWDGQDGRGGALEQDRHSSSSSLSRAPTAGVVACGMALMSTHPRDYNAVLQLSIDLPRQVTTSNCAVEVVACLGVHPWFLHELSDADLAPESLATDSEEVGEGTNADAASARAAWLVELEALLVLNPRAIVGEIGLDGFHFDPITKDLVSPIDSQVEAFRSQLELAALLRRPVSVHCVQAFGSMMQVLSDAKRRKRLPSKLYFHAFGGKVGTIKQLLSICSHCDVYFGFASIVNFRSPKTSEVVKFVGLDRLLLESDHEDAALVGESLREAVSYYARALDVSEEQVVEATTRNAARFYGLQLGSPSIA